MSGSERADDSDRSHSLPAVVVMVVEGQAFRRGAACGAECRAGLGGGELLWDICCGLGTGG